MMNKNSIQNNDYEIASTKQDLSNQIDDIINKYKSQLIEFKENSSKRNNSFVNNSSKLKTIKKEENSDLNNEIKNDNIRLQSLLIEERLKSTKLKSQIENYEYELKNAKTEINELNKNIEKRENDFNQKVNDMKKKLNDAYNDIDEILKENNLNKNLIQNIFELFNNHINIFYKSKIISLNDTQKINYLEDDFQGNNYKKALYILNNIDILIKKLLQDNKELYEQLIEVKKIMDEQKYIQSELESLKGIKKEYLLLKQDNEALKKNNMKLENNLLELNKYINNNLCNIKINNQIKHSFPNNKYNNIYNYKNLKLKSYPEPIYNTDNNYNNINKDSYNSSKNYNNIRNNNYNKNKKKLTIKNINNNYSSRLDSNNRSVTYSKTDENRNINYIENYKLIRDHSANNYNENNDINNRFEPIEKLKKKIMILEEQIKNNQ